jgi:hypothetical protein
VLISCFPLLISQEPTSPALVYSLAQLEEQLKKAYRTVTEGKFR